MLPSAHTSALLDDVALVSTPMVDESWMEAAMHPLSRAEEPVSVARADVREWSNLQPEMLVLMLELCTPLEACRAAAVCTGWKAAATSNTLWGSFVKRRFNAATEPRTGTKIRLRADERKNWRTTYRDWHEAARIPRGALVSRHSIQFASGSQLIRAAGLGTSSCPVGLGLVVWMVVAHSADVRLRSTPPAAARALLADSQPPNPPAAAQSPADETPISPAAPDFPIRSDTAGSSAALARLAGRNWLRLRLLVQNTIPRGTRCAASAGSSDRMNATANPRSRVSSQAASKLTAYRHSPEQSWPLAPVLVSAAGIRVRLKDGSTVPCLPLSGPAVVALNGQALKSSSPKTVDVVLPSSCPPEAQDEQGGDVAGDIDPAETSASPASDASASEPITGLSGMPWLHDCVGGGCACGYGSPELAAVKGLMDWKVSSPTGGESARELSSPPPRSMVVLRANEFAVMDVWAPFDDDVLFEPEALERCQRIEIPVRRADGVGQSTSVKAPIMQDRQIWEQYQYLAGGGMCLTPSDSGPL